MNPIFASTSFLGESRSDVADALDILLQTDIDGIELGSTHRPQPDFKNIVRAFGYNRFLVHNYCPPATDNLVLNVASCDPDIARRSIDHIKQCIDFSADIEARLYTFHPGFTAEPVQPGTSKINYDFLFSTSTQDASSASGRLYRALDEIIPYAQSAGVAIALETEGSRRHPDKLLLQQPAEFENLLSHYGREIGVNLNLAHTLLAERVFGFSAAEFIRRIKPAVRVVELSHCDLQDDQHRPLVPDSFVFDHLPYLQGDVPLILEFRNATRADITKSLQLLRAALT